MWIAKGFRLPHSGFARPRWDVTLEGVPDNRAGVLMRSGDSGSRTAPRRCGTCRAPLAGAAAGAVGGGEPPPPQLGYRGAVSAGGADDGGAILADGVQDAGDGRMDRL